MSSFHQKQDSATDNFTTYATEQERAMTNYLRFEAKMISHPAWIFIQEYIKRTNCSPQELASNRDMVDYIQKRFDGILFDECSWIDIQLFGNYGNYWRSFYQFPNSGDTITIPLEIVADHLQSQFPNGMPETVGGCYLFTFSLEQEYDLPSPTSSSDSSIPPNENQSSHH
jgi:hypothetical protein